MKVRCFCTRSCWSLVLLFAACSAESDRVVAGNEEPAQFRIERPAGRLFVVSNGLVGSPNDSGKDYAVEAVDDRGRIEWTNRERTVGDQAVTAASVDPAGNLIVAGHSSTRLTPDTGRIFGNVRESQRIIFVRMIDPKGDTIWTREVAVGDTAMRAVVNVRADGISLGVTATGPLAFGKSSVVARGESLPIGEMSGAGVFSPISVTDLVAKGELVFGPPLPACGHSPCLLGPPPDFATGAWG
jgi:hypothetical protein